jgi:hypothetical protein
MDGLDEIFIKIKEDPGGDWIFEIRRGSKGR